MDFNEVMALSEQFDKGAPIPVVDAAELKKMWTTAQWMEAKYGPPKQDQATGLAALGINADSHSTAEVLALSKRNWLLDIMVKRGVLKDFQQEDTLDDRVFSAAANVPLTQPEMYVSIMSLYLVAKPEEIVAKVKKDFQDHGYDLDHPAIESKFLAWLREHC